MRNFYSLFFLFLLLLSGRLHAEGASPQLIFREANSAYRTGNYSKASSLYESLTQKEEGRKAGVFYNLGNAHFKEGHLGLAILNYEKAKRLRPRDPDISANLKYARSLLEYQIEDKRNWYLKVAEALLGSFTEREIGIINLTLGLLFWTAWLVCLYFRPPSVWGWKRKTLLVLMLVSLSLWVLKGVDERQLPEAIVLKAEAPVRYGPSYKDRMAFRLGEGMKVRIHKKEGEWSRVVLVNGETGWMFHEDMAEV